MKKMFALAFLFLILLSLVSALNLTISEYPIEDVIIKEVDESAIFELNITNPGPKDSFRIFSFVGVEIRPSEKFEIGSGETKTVTIQAQPSEEIRENFKNWFLFEYRIAGSEPGTYKDNLKIKLIPLAEIIEIEPIIISPSSDEAFITINNLEDKYLEDLILKFNSDFFEYTEAFSLKPFETKTISAPIGDLESLEAGEYQLITEIQYKGAKSEIISEINYLEESGILDAKDSKGFIVVTTHLSKENIGNVESPIILTERKNIISRLFTTFSPLPDESERNGFFVTYIWRDNLQPGEALEVTMRTNYTFPFLLLLLAIGLILFVRIKTQTDLVLKKRVQFVRTKGGEFALRVRLKAKARNNMEDVKITDHIPGTTQIHEKMIYPHAEVDEKTRRILWNIKSMRKGEERTFSYVIYSKMKIFGSFELPIAHASYKSDNQQKHVSSNKTSFAAEGA